MKRWTALLLSCVAFVETAVAQDTIFTFNGRLTDSAALANNVYDVQFELFSAQSGGVSVSAVVSTNNLPVTNGLFTAFLDFGAAPFTGATRFLEIRVRPGGTADPFTTLTPRIRLTSVPYAIRAAVATTVSGSAGLRIVTNAISPNLIGGYSGNYVPPGIHGATIAGGGRADSGDDEPNEVNAIFGTVGGGLANHIHGAWSTIAGGFDNRVYGYESFIGGGRRNRLHGDGSVIAGGYFHYTGPNAFRTVIAGGYHNSIESNANYAAIGGGSENTIYGYYHYLDDPPRDFPTNATIGGGAENLAQRPYATIGGGVSNVVGSKWSVVGGGKGNRIPGAASGGLTLQEGVGNTISGGEFNFIGTMLSGSAIGGGTSNSVSASYAVVPGGFRNRASGSYSLAGGRRAQASHAGAFVWADSQDADFTSARVNEFVIRAAGGVRIESDRGISLNAADRPIITRGFDPFDSSAPAYKQGHGRWGLFMEPLNLVVGMPNGLVRNFQFAKYNLDGTRVELARIDHNGNLFTTGSVNPPSDRNVKTNFASINATEILQRLVNVPIQHWAYTNKPGVRHIGPMAQDFHAAFGVGADDKHISTVDADGVALAAIQGLHQQLQETRQELASKDAEIKQLRDEYASLKQIVRDLAQKFEEPASVKPAELRTGL